MGRDIGGIGEPIKKTSDKNYLVNEQQTNYFFFSISDIPFDDSNRDVARSNVI
jgi:hypothetical protein